MKNRWRRLTILSLIGLLTAILVSNFVGMSLEDGPLATQWWGRAPVMLWAIATLIAAVFVWLGAFWAAERAVLLAVGLPLVVPVAMMTDIRVAAPVVATLIVLFVVIGFVKKAADDTDDSAP